MWRRATASLLAGGLIAVGASCTKKDKPKPDPVARGFLAAVASGDLARAAALTDADPALVVREHTDALKGLEIESTTLELGAVQTQGTTATAAFKASRAVTGFDMWTYDGQLRLARTDDRWQVVWEPAAIHPQLEAGMRLETRWATPRRASILDATGKPLFAEQPTVRIGIAPNAFADRTRSLAIIARATGVDAKTLAAKLAAASPTAFVEVITLRRPAYDKVKSRIHQLKGLRFEKSTAILAPSATFARALLGRVGVATAEQLAAAGPAFKPGHVVGQGGLQGAFQDQLSGAPSGAIIGVVGDEVTATLHEAPGQAPRQVKTTIDRRVQGAAEKALGAGTTPTALVAVRPSTGEVLAVANRPSDFALNRAFEGRYPPGSTFKVVTTAGLLSRGVRPTDKVPCPRAVVVGGKSFRNFEGESAGSVPFSTDFAHSCNTAFVSLADRIGEGTLPATAEIFGLGGKWKMSVPAYSGSVPEPRDKTDLAAMMIGQGRVLVSPLAMAVVTAAVADGSSRSPVLVTEPAQQEQLVTPLGKGGVPIGTLRALMRQVVTDGTGTKAEAPGGVSGKTGTAEFGDKAPLKTHAWFIGYSGDVAVAVIVEGDVAKRSGGKDAAPIVGRFFKAIR